MRILLVEDDKKLAAFIQRGLQEENYAVDVCGDGEDGLFYAETNPYDVIILDVMLPKKNGLVVCRELRGRSVLIPILMLTARDSLDDRVAGLSEGADDYLVKPFHFEELLARVRSLARRNSEYKGKTLQAADLELDPFKRLVRRAGKEIELTGKEYALLEYLLRNKGRIVTSAMIIENIWDMNYDGMSNVVNVYINHLRKKIDGFAARKLIQTIRGQGFRIHEN